MAVKAPFILGTGTHDLDDAVFGAEFHMALVHEAARADLNARRRGTQSAKTRGEVNMTGAKAFRQKGTGRARAGALSTPQRYGGGVAFAPKPRHYISKVNRKARRAALRSALSVHADRGSLGMADPGALDAPSTKQAAEALGKLEGEGRVLLVCGGEGEDTVVKSFRNLSGLQCKPVTDVGVADVIGAARLVLTPNAADYLTKIASKERATEAEEATS
jgi:large subunit ribosomal protein L4